MEIASGLNSLMLSHMLNRNSSGLARSATRLSSGLRINSARDDAAGLAISERFTSRIRGLRVGQRNLNDAISMLQVADGGLNEVTSMLQRMRELSVRAANTGGVNAVDRKKLQIELGELTMEIQRSLNSTEFNGVHILTPLVEGSVSTSVGGDPNADLKYALQASWMSEAESAINTYFGLSADNVDLNVIFDDTGSIGSEGAAVTLANFNAGTTFYDDLTLTIDTAEFAGASLPNGGTGPIYYDRIIAREMAVAVMARTINTDPTNNGVPEWFTYGAAELLVGGDERVAANGGLAGSKPTTAALGAAWTGSSLQKSQAYLAVRYINDRLKLGGKTMVDLFNELEAAGGGANKLGKAMDAALGLTGGAKYNTDSAVIAEINGYAFAGYDFANADTGAVGGTDADGGARDTTSTGVINDVESYQANPTNFNVIFPVTGGAGTTIGTSRSQGQLHYDFQFGSNEGDHIRVNLEQHSVYTMDIHDLDLVKRAQEAIVKIDAAIDQVVNARARFGSQMNKLEHTLANLETSFTSYSNTRSRIADADYAVEMSQFTMAQLLNNSSSSMMAQANGDQDLVMNLLTSSDLTSPVNPAS